MNRILMVVGSDRDSDAFERTIEIKEQEFEFFTVNSIREAWREVDTDSISAVLSFPTLNGDDGISFLQRVKAENPSIATILLLEPDNASPINRGFEVGIDQAISFDPNKKEEIAQIIRDILLEKTRSSNTSRMRILSTVILDCLSSLSGVKDLDTLLSRLPGKIVDRDTITLAWTSKYIEEVGEFHPIAGEGINPDLLRPMNADEFDLGEDYIQIHNENSQQVSVRIGDGSSILGILHLYTSAPGFQRPEQELLRSFSRLLERILSSATGPEDELEDELESDRDGFEFTRSTSKSQGKTEQELTSGSQREESERTELEVYAGVLSHELRNYLHKAQSYLEFGEAAGGDDYLRHVQDAHQDIENVLHKAEAVATRDVPPEHRELVSVGVAAENARRRLDGERMNLVFDDPGNIKANPELLDLLIENILRNAIENVGEDVTVTVGGLPDGFYIMDNGPGIPENIQDRLFEWGFSTREGGEGIGLAIVGRIVESHDWSITVTEGPDGGARFEIHDAEVE